MMGSLWECANVRSLACSCIVLFSVRFVAVKWRLTGRPNYCSGSGAGAPIAELVGCNAAQT
jgi:hypothetical protein